MQRAFDFNDLFIYDLANNHQGDLDHASEIVRSIGAVNRQRGARGALKFQFRQLDTFIHPRYRERMDLKYVKRFMETRLSLEAFKTLARQIEDAGMLTMCTPFDEASVDIICDMGLDLIKVGSCSADDRPLLHKIARVNKPVVVSTAGLRIEEIDWLVNFLESESVEFALMHCVAEYPTPAEHLQLNQVAFLRERYRGVTIGWSTHEDPDNYAPVQLARALGARLFERHVGIKSDKYPLNKYSSTPEQIGRWLDAWHDAGQMMGADERVPSSPLERQTLIELKRGVYARNQLKRGQAVELEDVYFAMPVEPQQLISSHFRPGMLADDDYEPDQAIHERSSVPEVSEQQLVYQIMLQVRGMLNKAGVHINQDASIEISHHYGLQRFREYGAVIITCVNRAYAKKLVVQLPRQKHPYHYHELKEETFQLLDGDLEIVKNGMRRALYPGDTFLVEAKAWHKFHTLAGAIVEEVSTTHQNDDSIYEDPVVAAAERGARKTKVDNWMSYFRSNHAISIRPGR